MSSCYKFLTFFFAPCVKARMSYTSGKSRCEKKQKCGYGAKGFQCNNPGCTVPYIADPNCKGTGGAYCCPDLGGCETCSSSSSCDDDCNLGYLANDRYQKKCPDMKRKCDNKCKEKHGNPCKNPNKCCRDKKSCSSSSSEHSDKKPCCNSCAKGHKCEKDKKQKKPCCGGCAKGHKCEGSKTAKTTEDTSEAWLSLCNDDSKPKKHRR